MKLTVKNNGKTVLNEFQVHYSLERIHLASFCNGPDEINVNFKETSVLPGDSIEVDLDTLTRDGIYYDPQAGYKFYVSVSAPNGKLGYQNDQSAFSSGTYYLSFPTATISKTDAIEFEVQPNPVQHELTVKIPQDCFGSQICIYSLDGKVIMKENISNRQQIIIDTKSLNCGVYQVVVNSLSQYNSKRFVKIE